MGSGFQVLLILGFSFALARSLLLNRRWGRMEGAQGRRQGRDPLPTTHGRHQPASSNHGRLLQHHYNYNPAPQDLLQGYVFPPTCTHILSLRPPPAPIPHFLSFPPSLPPFLPHSFPPYWHWVDFSGDNQKSLVLEKTPFAVPYHGSSCYPLVVFVRRSAKFSAQVCVIRYILVYWSMHIDIYVNTYWYINITSTTGMVLRERGLSRYVIKSYDFWVTCTKTVNGCV